MRKRLFNQIEDMKGKIRVYARTRPMSNKETTEGQNIALKFPDPFTLEHPWKEEKKPRSYQFDAVFDGTASQEKVFEDTKYLVQSAIDGYNVCIFAYGQTGSGKTHTINGSPSSPGLTPRAIEELFRNIERDSTKYTFKLNVYMLELYQETLLDLLYDPPKVSGPQKPDPPSPPPPSPPPSSPPPPSPPNLTPPIPPIPHTPPAPPPTPLAPPLDKDQAIAPL